ncbi:hypothetical protein EJ05DRAFT_154333 [Pseudovirgaria hyperparasitica]|uniref:Uncharacterized protein n=1 Tax=Pseudovirgaria hyperparasitica TaxID=470096 RepID=A0A6A6VU93_9PEZI|nr:uncharacterized protein EJ05DRAFT_154333 [Pseudovirgaria hyperparasitica]KAF2754258.1 hypothetical protein EJ05DRAFT_154333 [Pseudovirgaria hyperparasitica]
MGIGVDGAHSELLNRLVRLRSHVPPILAEHEYTTLDRHHRYTNCYFPPVVFLHFVSLISVNAALAVSRLISPVHHTRTEVVKASIYHDSPCTPASSRRVQFRPGIYSMGCSDASVVEVCVNATNRCRCLPCVDRRQPHRLDRPTSQSGQQRNHSVRLIPIAMAERIQPQVKFDRQHISDFPIDHQ